VTIASSAMLNERDPLPVCGDCPEPALDFSFTVHDVPLGMHQLTARYESDSRYAASDSEPLMHVVLPQLSAPTATGTGQSFIGATGGDSLIVSRCDPVKGAWTTVESAVTAGSVAPYRFPHGLFAYRLENCAVVNAFLPMLGATQYLVMQLPAPLPSDAVFVGYGPTKDNATPHWHEMPAEIDGATVRVLLLDGDAGDDDLAINSVITGIGGPAIAAPEPVDVVEFYQASLDHYLITVDAAEMSDLDRGIHPGWNRTGAGFKAFLPDLDTGRCAAATVPVYRVWNASADSNHRYTTSRALRDQLVANGYVAEGYGNDQVVFCAPP